MKSNRVILNPAQLMWRLSAAVVIAGGLVSSASAIDPSISGNWQQLYTTSSTDSYGNTTYSLDFHVTAGGIPITTTGLPSGLSGAVTEDLSVSYGSSGVANGSGGPVTLSELVITQGPNQATYDITGATLTQYGSLSNPGSWVGLIDGGTATLETAANKTTPAFLADLSSMHTASFSASYTGAFMESSSMAPLLASSGQAGFTAISAVPEPGSIITCGIGAAMLGGYLWRRRTASKTLQTRMALAAA